MPAVAFAMYKTARPERRKKIAAMLISAAIPAVLCGIYRAVWNLHSYLYHRYYLQ